MDIRDKVICAIYGLIALIALPATWINNIAFMIQADHASFSDFFQAAYANAAAASLSNDLFLLGFAASIFMLLEARRLKIRFVWLYIVFSAIIAISVTFPLFLLARQLKLAKQQHEPNRDRVSAA